MKYNEFIEQNYYAFCIGYDFLNGFFQKSNYAECDIVYGECQKLAREFMKSENYKNMKNSGYENLENWVEENKEEIKANYQEGKEFKNKDKLKER